VTLPLTFWARDPISALFYIRTLPLSTGAAERVPVGGDFGGPQAIRAIAVFLKKHGATVSAFYLSNVEQYLQQDGIINNFCKSVATLPMDDTSTFIRSTRGGYGPGPGLNSELGLMAAEVKNCR
jgi:hypothetical protein